MCYIRGMVDGVQVPTPKEQKEILSRMGEGLDMEKVPVVERKAEVGPEMKDWMSKLEEGEDIQLPQPVKDGNGEVLVEAVANQQPKIVLPLIEETYKIGLNSSVSESVRWLAEWCKRLLKMFPGRTELRISK